MDRPQRLVFGSVAEAYDAHRPGYPATLLDELTALVPAGASGLDVGAGTGKVAAAIAARGLVGTALEPDPEMAAVAARHLDGTGWDVVVGELERCDLPDRSVDLVTCAQAWHWIDHDAGLAQIRRLLRPAGVAAIFWNRPDFSATPGLRADMDAVYARLEPDLESSIAATGHAPKGAPPAVDPAPDGFVDAREAVHRQVVRYTSASWTALLGTHSDHLLLPEPRRQALHAAVGEVIADHGGSFELTYRCEAWIARRA